MSEVFETLTVMLTFSPLVAEMLALDLPGCRKLFGDDCLLLMFEDVLK